MHLDCASCTVRDWRPSDRDSLVRFANNRKVWRNLTHRFPHPFTEADAEAWFAFLARMPEPTHWAIEVEGIAVGGVGLDLGEGVYAKCGHFGYWLGEPYWGRGIMTEAVRAASQYALSHFGLVRLEAPVFAWNPASMRVLEKCGFVREGVLGRSVFKDGQIIDAVVYALRTEDGCRMTGPVELTAAQVPEDFAAARALFLEYAAWLGVDLCFQGFAEELEHLPEMYGPPSGCLILEREAGGVVGCVGVRRLSSDTCEMKRLFVRDLARGTGLGRRLAEESVAAGRRLGYGRMVLDTLEGMAAARHVYEALGFRETAAYYENPLPGVRYYELVIDGER